MWHIIEKKDAITEKSYHLKYTVFQQEMFELRQIHNSVVFSLNILKALCWERPFRTSDINIENVSQYQRAGPDLTNKLNSTNWLKYTKLINVKTTIFHEQFNNSLNAACWVC